LCFFHLRILAAREDLANIHSVNADKVGMTWAFLFLFLSPALVAQTGGAQVGVSFGSVGGSYYDIPVGHQLSKYGPERLSPTGISFTGTLKSDQWGNLYVRKLSVQRKEDQTKLGSQTLFLYDSPHLVLKESKKGNLFINGKVMHYDQKNHFMYFKVDQELTPSLDQNLELSEHARVDQFQTYVAPAIGACAESEKNWRDFELSGFVQGSLSPVAFLHYETKLTENKMDHAKLDYLNKSGQTFSFGGELVVEGVAKYRDQFYFKVRVEQSYFQGLNRDKASVTNRISHLELGYLVTKNLSLNLNVENNELLFHQKDRHAIDVYNIVGLGLKYSLATQKK
jgi:hypothetical protein